MSTLLIAYLVGCVIVLLIWVWLIIHNHTQEEIDLGELLLMLALILASWPGLIVALVAILQDLKVMKVVVFRIKKRKNHEPEGSEV